MAGKFKTNSFKALNYQLGVLMHNTLKDMEDDITQKAKDIIDDKVYMVNSPKDYDRSYDLRESVIVQVKEKGKVAKFSLEISHDPSQIIYEPELNRHGTDSDISDVIDNIVDEGLSGHKFGDGYWREARPYKEAIGQEIIDSGWLQKELMARLNF